MKEKFHAWARATEKCQYFPRIFLLSPTKYFFKRKSFVNECVYVQRVSINFSYTRSQNFKKVFYIYILDIRRLVNFGNFRKRRNFMKNYAKFLWLLELSAYISLSVQHIFTSYYHRAHENMMIFPSPSERKENFLSSLASIFSVKISIYFLRIFQFIAEALFDKLPLSHSPPPLSSTCTNNS
jgi:hypothetical protein